MGMFYLLLAFGLVVWIYYSKINVEINYKRADKQDRGEIILSCFGGLLHYRISIPSVDFKNIGKGVKVESSHESVTKKQVEDTFINKDKLEFMYEHYELLLHRVKYFHEIVRWFMSRIHCKKWDWKTKIGTGDAAEAGILTGIIWGVKTTLLGFISHYIQWDYKPQLEVTPNFQQALLETSFEGRFSFTLGSAVRFFLILWYRMKKGEKKSAVVSMQQTSNM